MIDPPLVNFTFEELVVMCGMLLGYATKDGEDTIGILLKNGAFHILRQDGAIAELSRKIDQMGEYERSLYDHIKNEAVMRRLAAKKQEEPT